MGKIKFLNSGQLGDALQRLAGWVLTLRIQPSLVLAAVVAWLRDLLNREAPGGGQ